MKIFKISIAILAGIMLLIGLFMIVEGSLEAFPTAEQIGKARIGGIVLVTMGVSIEAAILMGFGKTKKKNKN